MEKAKTVGVWVAIVLMSLAFLAAGSAKLAGVPMMHAEFATMGLPDWFAYFIGAAEVAGALGLYVRQTSAWAAAGLFIITLGAIYFHLTYHVPSPIPAIVLAILAAIVFFARRKKAIFVGQPA